MSKLPTTPPKDYNPNQVVFIKQHNSYKPAKIHLKSSYGTYLIKIYGNRDVCYVSEYTIQPYSQDIVMSVRDESKKLKKVAKYLKSAQKDHQKYIKSSIKQSQQKHLNLCKQQQFSQQQQLQPSIQSTQLFPPPQPILSKYKTILNLKVQTLISNYHSTKQSRSCPTQLKYHSTLKQNTKQLLMKKLKWSLQDIYMQKSTQATQILIINIIQSQIIQPIQYIITSLFNKIYLCLQYYQHCKYHKLKNYLTSRYNIILNGLQNYFNNYSIFLNIKAQLHQHGDNLQTGNLKNG